MEAEGDLTFGSFVMFITEFSYFVVLGQSPNSVDPHSYMCGSYIGTWRLHLHPGGT